MNSTAPVAAPSWDDDIPRIHALWGPAAGFPTAIPAGAVPPGIDNALLLLVAFSPQGSIPAGTSFQAAITLRNIGSNAWIKTVLAADGNLPTGYCGLGSQVAENNRDWGTSRILLPADVAPGATVVLNATLVSGQSAVGLRSCNWRMVRELIAWFGYPVEGLVNINASQVPPPPIAKPPDFSRVRLIDDAGKPWHVTAVAPDP